MPGRCERALCPNAPDKWLLFNAASGMVSHVSTYCLSHWLLEHVSGHADGLQQPNLEACLTMAVSASERAPGLQGQLDAQVIAR